MRLLYAPLVSDKEVRIEAFRLRGYRKGRMKEDNDVSEDGALCPMGRTDNRGGMLAQLMVEALVVLATCSSFISFKVADSAKTGRILEIEALIDNVQAHAWSSKTKCIRLMGDPSHRQASSPSSDTMSKIDWR